MKRIMLVLVLLTLPAVCSAQIYQWVDEHGQVGFADDLGNVPAKYRQKATQIDKQEEAVEINENVEPEKGSRKGDEVKKAPAAVDGKTKAKEEEKVKKMYAGKDGAIWKRDFAQLKFELKQLGDQAAGYRERMANPGKMSRGEYLLLQNTLRDLEYKISAAEKKLQTLNDAADSAEVPAEFR